MDDNKINQYGDELYDCWLTRRTVAPLRGGEPGVTIGDAYKIPERLVAGRVGAGGTVAVLGGGRTASRAAAPAAST